MTQRLKIIEYFDSLVNEIDLKAEKLLLKPGCECFCENLCDKHQPLETLINKRRNAFIDTIENLKNHNLNCLNEITNDKLDDQYRIFDKYCFILDKYDMKMEHTQDLFEPDEIKINQTFGYLVVLEDGCLTEREWTLFKEVLYYGNDLDDEELEEEIFQPEQDHKFYKQIEKNYNHLTESNIFNGLLKYTRFIKVRFSVFNDSYTANDFIIRTNKRELFRAKSIDFQDSWLRSNTPNISGDTSEYPMLTVKREAVELFFNHSIKINILESSNVNSNTKDVQILLNLLKWFESNLTVELINLKLCIEYDYQTIAIVNELSAMNYVNLEDLNMSGNRIKYVDSEAFSGLVKLKNLNLSNNNLKTIDCLQFKHCGNLVILDLSSNPITNIDDATFSNLHNLKTLLLDDVLLRSIGEFLFNGLTCLQTLNITSAYQIEIHPMSLCRLDKLLFLTLYSLAKPVDDETFTNLVNLKSLHLSGISCFDCDLFKSLRHLEELELEVDYIVNEVDLSLFGCLKKLRFFCKKIHHIHAETFSGSSSLDEFTLRCNQLMKIDPNGLHGFDNVTKLKLVRNELENVEPGTFDRLLNLKELAINFSNLSSFDAYLVNRLINLQNVDLSSNRLIRIDARTFLSLNNLKSLNLGWNEISFLDENAFAGLFNLRVLNLNNNRLVRLCSNIFVDLKNLTKLTVANNLIETLDPFGFNGLSRINGLNLKCNRIKRIQSTAFEQLTNLLELNLSSNQIEQVEGGTFARLTCLETLFLNENKLACLQEDVFVGLTNLRQLHLNDNELKSLTERQFNGLTSLKNLRLEGNQTELVDSNAFDQLLNLKRLSLMKNNLTKLDVGLFKNLSKLTSLSLNSNRIEKIQSGVFDALINLKELHLNENKIEFIENNSFDKLNRLTCLDLRFNLFKQVDCLLFENLLNLERLSISDEIYLCNEQFLKFVKIF